MVIIGKISTYNRIKLCEKIHGFCTTNFVLYPSIQNIRFAVTFVSPDHPLTNRKSELDRTLEECITTGLKHCYHL